MFPRSFETITVEISERLALVTVNRPQVRNALNAQVLRELRDCFDDLATDDSVAAVAVTGAGDRTFVAGADISELASYTLETGLHAEMARLFDDIESFDKPTIAAVDGYALGGGCELAMACDIRIATDQAHFGLPETTLSVLPGAGGTQRLARLIGTGRAIDMILTGRLATADEALAIGLVTRMVRREKLFDEVRALADDILAKGPLAVRLAKLVIRTGMDSDQRSGLVVERLAQALLYTTADKREGAAAFLEKRTPAFRGA